MGSLFTTMILLLTCCVTTNIGLCEDSSFSVEEGQTAHLYFMLRFSGRQIIHHCSSNRKQRYIADVDDNQIYNINKPDKYEVSKNRSHIIITILNVSIDDTGLYVAEDWTWQQTMEVIRLSVEGTDILKDVDTVITRRGSTVRFPETKCRYLFFRPTDSSSSFGEYFNSINFSRIGCSDSITANEDQEGCYVMFYYDGYYGIYIQRIQFSEKPPAFGLPFRLEHQYNGSTIRHVEDNGTTTLTLPSLPVPYFNNGIYQCISYTDIKTSTISQNKSITFNDTDSSFLIVNKYTVTCFERSLDPKIYLRLEHSFMNSPIRYTEAQANETVQLPLFPIPFHNNGVYKCIFYTDTEKSGILQTKSLLYDHKGLPVFAEGNRHWLQGQYGRNLSVKVSVYSNPNITEIEVIGENRSTDGFIVHDIKTLPASLNGWTGPSVNIPGWEITIDIMFHIQQNVTLYLIVDNILGSNKFKMTAVIEEPTTPDVSSLYSFISVVTCILGILLFCIITTRTVNRIIMKRRRSTTVEMERSPYTYDEIGTIDYRLTNVPPPIRDVVVPGITRRMELNRTIQNFSQDQISIEMVDGNEIESVIETQSSEMSSIKTEVIPEDKYKNEMTFNMEQLVADINVNVLVIKKGSEDSESSSSEISEAPVESRGQGLDYENAQYNTPLEHLYSESVNSNIGNNANQEDSYEYINLQIW